MWCYLQVKLCDPRLSALSVPPWPKKRYINTLPFLFLLLTPNYVYHIMETIMAHVLLLYYYDYYYYDYYYYHHHHFTAITQDNLH